MSLQDTSVCIAAHGLATHIFGEFGVFFSSGARQAGMDSGLFENGTLV